MKEHRTAHRYDLALPVTIQVSIDNDLTSLQGVTRDISTRGVYFTVGDEFAVGMKLGLTMRVPTTLTGGIEVFILAFGQLVRVEKRWEDGVQSVGVAAVIGRCEYFRNGIPDNSARRLSSLVRSVTQ